MRSAGPIPFFVDDVDRTDFCRRLSKAIETRRWLCRAFCLMTTHFHLLLDVGDDSIQAGMHQINGQYAQQFNRRHGRSGHLCGDRYGSVRTLSDMQMLRTFRYIARNPVEGGLCASPADWIWGSYRGCIGLDPDFPFVTHAPMQAYFGGASKRAVQELRDFVEGAVTGTVPVTGSGYIRLG
jgi:putative transposase